MTQATFATKAVHSGVLKDSSYNSVITPIYPSSTFAFDAVGKNKGYDYTRSGNPTRAGLEENIRALEGGVGCRCTATGMAAITAVLHLCKPGDHVIAGHDIYGGTYRLMASIYAERGIDFSFVDMREPANVKAALTDRTVMVWVETPSNPLLNIVDIAAVAALVQDRPVRVVVDNTFMSPYLQQPLALGATISLHSTTKYINGHSDIVGGAIVSGNENTAQEIAYLVNALGVSESPWDAWLALRGIKTLPYRMAAHQTNAEAIALFLDQHPKVKKVWYPGLPSHPQHELAKTQASGFGGMVSFEIDPAEVPLDPFFAKLKWFTLAESLGGVESLIESPWYMSHASMDETARVEAGITPGVIRVSTGIEAPADLVADLRQALDENNRNDFGDR